MGLATAVSRATGFARTVALAWALGATALGDAYNVANTAPNMVFQLAAGGVLSSAVVPLLARARGDDERREAASVLYGLALAGGIVAMLLVLAAAPLVVAALTAGGAGRADHDEVVAVGTTWLRMFAAQVPAYALGVYGVAVMTFHRRLVLGAAASIATNIVTVAGVAGFVVIAGRRPPVGAVDSGAVLFLGAATTIGVLAMAAAQLWGAHRSESGLVPKLRLRHPVTRAALRTAPWVVLYVAVNQAGLAVVTSMASTVEGGVSAYQWSFAVMQLPHAVVGVSLISAAFPRIAAAAAGGGDTSALLRTTVERMVPVLVAAAAVLAVLAPVIGAALVGPSGASLVAGGVIGFAAGLLPFSLFQLLTRTSYALADTRTPALVNVAVNAVNVGVNAAVLVLTAPGSRRVAGLALGHALSYVVGSVALAKRLKRVNVRAAVKADVALRATLLAVVAGVAAIAGSNLGDRSSQSDALAATAAGAAAAVAAAGVAWALGRAVLNARGRRRAA